MIGRVSLDGMEFYAFHGCYDEEQTIGNTFVVDVSFDINISVALQTDLLEDTIDYQKAYNIVKKEMEYSSHLLEHVAGRILKSLEAELSGISNIVIKVAKLNPPLGGKVISSSVTISK